MSDTAWDIHISLWYEKNYLHISLCASNFEANYLVLFFFSGSYFISLSVCTIPCRALHPFIPLYIFLPDHPSGLHFLPFTESLFALSLVHQHITPAGALLNVTSHLWLRPVLFIAGQLKCEGSQWEDKYNSQQTRGLSQTKPGSSPSLYSLSSPPFIKGKRTDYLMKYCDVNAAL